jgi:hypothetical protein
MGNLGLSPSLKIRQCDYFALFQWNLHERCTYLAAQYRPPCFIPGIGQERLFIFLDLLPPDLLQAGATTELAQLVDGAVAQN